MPQFGFDTLALLVVIGLAGPLLAAVPGLGIPMVVGELIAGIVVGRTGFNIVEPADPTLQLLAKAWSTADPDKFDAVNDTIRKMSYRGVNGFYRFDNPYQAPLHYPLETQKLEEGIAHLFFQVQGGQHRIISPDTLKEVAFKAPPWMK